MDGKSYNKPIRSFKHLISLLLIFLFCSCTERNPAEEALRQSEDCPCDSIGKSEVNDGTVIDCFLGKSLLTIAHLPNNDTMEVTRRYTTDKVWHFQEFMVIANNKLIVPDYARYCDIKDTAEFYKLTYFEDQDLFINQGVTTHSILGVELVLNKDTIKSNNLSLLVLKEKFKGILKIERITDMTYKGKREKNRGFIFIEAESMIKYGNLLEQYKAINRLCNRNCNLCE
jgi:hypothetical protein